MPAHPTPAQVLTYVKHAEQSKSRSRDNYYDYLNAAEGAYEEAGRHGTGNIVGHEIIRSMSGEDSTVYRNSAGQFIIAYRGTRFDRHPFSDAAADIAIATGFEFKSPRFQKALSTYWALRQLHPKADIHLTGHSLGGGMAAYVARATGEGATVYNPGIGIDAIPRTIVGVRNPHIEIHRVPTDPLSVGSELPSEGIMKRYRQRQYNPHGTHRNFRPSPTKEPPSQYRVAGEIIDHIING